MVKRRTWDGIKQALSTKTQEETHRYRTQHSRGYHNVLECSTSFRMGAQYSGGVYGIHEGSTTCWRGVATNIKGYFGIQGVHSIQEGSTMFWRGHSIQEVYIILRSAQH